MDWRHYWECYRPALIRAARTFGMVFVPVLFAKVVEAGTVTALATMAVWDAAFVAGLGALGSLVMNSYEIRKDVDYDRG